MSYLTFMKSKSKMGNAGRNGESITPSATIRAIIEVVNPKLANGFTTALSDRRILCEAFDYLKNSKRV